MSHTTTWEDLTPEAQAECREAARLRDLELRRAAADQRSLMRRLHWRHRHDHEANRRRVRQETPTERLLRRRHDATHRQLRRAVVECTVSG